MRLMWKFLGFVVILLILCIGGLFLLPADRLGKLASDQLTNQLGRQVVLGQARVSVWPSVGISVDDVLISNDETASADPLLTAQKASFGLDPMQLLQGRFAFREIVIDSPTLRLPSAGGEASDSGQASENTATNAPSVSLETLRITNATFITDSTRIDKADLSVRWPDQNGPLQATAELTKDGAPLRLSATIQRPLTVMAGGASPMSLTLATPGGDIAFDGSAGTAPEAQGRVSLDLSDTARAVAALAQVGVTLPEGLGRSITGALSLTLTRDGTLAIRDAALKLDGNSLTAAADVTLTGKPRINAQITADALDLSGLMGGAGDAEATADQPASEGWSTAAIDASGLAAFDGEISLTTGKLDLGGMTFGNTRALMVVDNSRAVFDLREMRGYDGLLTGQFVANNRGGLSMRADVSFAGVSLQPLLKDAIGVDRFSGPADGSINLLGSGGSIAAIMSSLSGEGALRAGPGRIEGIDLEAALGGTASGGTTIFDTGTARFQVENGVLRNDDLTLALPRLGARGEGKIDLGAQRIDYLVTITDAKARDGRGLAFPVRIKGPWSDTQIRVDAGSLIDQNLAEERDALKQKARDKVNDALQDKLGIKAEPGQNVEDTLRNELEKRATDGLLNLLGK